VDYPDSPPAVSTLPPMRKGQRDDVAAGVLRFGTLRYDGDDKNKRG